MYFSTRTLSSLKLFNASLFAPSKASGNSYIDLTILIPFPPPPITALMRTGNPIFSASYNKLNDLYSLQARVLCFSMVTRYNWDLCISHDNFRFTFGAHFSYSISSWTNKDLINEYIYKIILLTIFRKLCIFR
jgi:hypothetical protein